MDGTNKIAMSAPLACLKWQLKAVFLHRMYNINLASMLIIFLFKCVRKLCIYWSLSFKMLLGVWMTRPMGEMGHLDAKLSLLKSILVFRPCLKTGFNPIYH